MKRKSNLLSVIIAMLLLTAMLTCSSVSFSEEIFAERSAQLLSPYDAFEASGMILVKTGENIYIPDIAPQITPYDQENPGPLEFTGELTSSNEAVATVDNDGLIYTLSEGECIITCIQGDSVREYQLKVADDAVPMAVQNYIYVVKREYYTTQKKHLEKANQYTKWYYQKKKGVGWCSVFTIYCANAAGNRTWKYKKSNESARFSALDYDDPPEICFMAEGEVGHQYDAFFKMNRFGSVPKPGYLVIYADLSNAYRTTHIASVVDVIDRGNGIYAVTTIEGNMSNTIKSYCYLYDSNFPNNLVGSDQAAKKQKLLSNMSELPDNEQTDPLIQYQLHTDHWTVFGFCETW